MSILCQKCQVIQINDAEHNGTIQTSAEGKDFIFFGDDNPESPYDWQKRLLLDYDLRDPLPSLPSLSRTAADGCALCSIIKNEITSEFLDRKVQYKELFIFKLGYYLVSRSGSRKKKRRRPCSKALSACFRSLASAFRTRKPQRFWLKTLFVYFKLLGPEEEREKDFSRALRLEIQADPGDSCAEWLSIPRRPVEASLSSGAGRERLHELIDLAVQVFPPALSTENHELPTRLVDVGFRDSTGEVEEPRLVITADYLPLQTAEQPQHYIALSYCWGPPDKAKLQLKTETSTLHDRLHRTPLSSLTETHRDLILLCRNLGIRYAWIDSLCIIQDDKADWEREAQKMGGVYANAYLTVCAALGDSCLDGFLQRRLPSQIIDVPFASSIKPSVSGQYSLFIAPNQPTRAHIEIDYFHGNLLADFLDPKPPAPDPYRFAMFSYQPYEEEVEKCSWHNRGWTFQEYRLAPRALVFSKSMVHVCIGGCWLESEDGSRMNTFTLPTHLSGLENEQAMVAKQTVHEWLALVQKYSLRSLTYQNDVLPAISALAQIWHNKVKGKYLAGIFSTDLHRGLLWAHFGRRTPAEFLKPTPPEKYVAPSWSWASQPDFVGHIFHVHTSFRSEVQLLDDTITVDGLNPYGRVKGGHLLLRTKICNIPATRLRRKIAFLDFNFPYELLSEDNQYLAHVLFDWRHSLMRAPKDPETGEEREDGPVGSLSMILISSKFTEERWKARTAADVVQKDLLLGLLVLPTGNCGEYKRAGLFFTEMDGPCGTKFWNELEPRTIKLV